MKRFLLFFFTLLLPLSGCATLQSFTPKPVEATNNYLAAPSINTVIKLKGAFTGPESVSLREKRRGVSNRVSAGGNNWTWIKKSKEKTTELITIYKFTKKTNMVWFPIPLSKPTELNINGKRVMYERIQHRKYVEFIFYLTDRSRRYCLIYETVNLDAEFEDIPLEITSYEKFAAMQQ